MTGITHLDCSEIAPHLLKVVPLERGPRKLVLSNPGCSDVDRPRDQPPAFEVDADVESIEFARFLERCGLGERPELDARAEAKAAGDIEGFPDCAETLARARAAYEAACAQFAREAAERGKAPLEWAARRRECYEGWLAEHRAGRRDEPRMFYEMRALEDLREAEARFGARPAVERERARIEAAARARGLDAEQLIAEERMEHEARLKERAALGGEPPQGPLLPLLLETLRQKEISLDNVRRRRVVNALPHNLEVLYFQRHAAARDLFGRYPLGMLRSYIALQEVRALHVAGRAGEEAAASARYQATLPRALALPRDDSAELDRERHRLLQEAQRARGAPSAAPEAKRERAV